MKLGGLFSGVGGFELAWTQLGHEVAWMCEIDPAARKVLEQRFPGVPIYEDIEQLDPYQVEAVDVVTGGSPCQGFSVAGTRTGLEHMESRLFADYVRVVDGLAERGLKFAVWENVPGVLSIKNDDGERTFENVVAALVGASHPVQLGSGKWNTGLADGGSRAVTWRVLDSRYFGVAQRRRRVFACVAFGDSCADRAGRALLAKSKGSRGDSEKGRKKRKGASGGVVASLAIPEGYVESLTPWPEMGEAMRVYGEGGRSPSLKQHSPNVLSDYGVRRLTPVECERLQGFPDDWTVPAGPDSARYKAMGNAVTVNTVRWVLGRILGVVDEEN